MPRQRFIMLTLMAPITAQFLVHFLEIATIAAAAAMGSTQVPRL